MCIVKLNIFFLIVQQFTIFIAMLRDNMVVKSCKQRFQQSESTARNVNTRNSFVFASGRSFLWIWRYPLVIMPYIWLIASGSMRLSGNNENNFENVLRFVT